MHKIRERYHPEITQHQFMGEVFERHGELSTGGLGKP